MSWVFEKVENATVREAAAFSVDVATEQSDLRHVAKVWRAVYGEECGWLRPAQDDLIKDQFHHASTYLLARASGHVVGTMRVVRRTDSGLPIEQFVDVSTAVEGVSSRNLVEVQRLMILPEFRNMRFDEMPFGVLAALVKGCLHWCLQYGVSHILADLFMNTETTPLEPLRALGFRETGLYFVDTELTEPDTSTALLLTIGTLFKRSMTSDAPFYSYLMERDDVVRVYA